MDMPQLSPESSPEYDEEEPSTSRLNNAQAKADDVDWLPLFSRTVSARDQVSSNDKTESTNRRKCEYCRQVTDQISSFAGLRSLLFVDSKLGTRYAKSHRLSTQRTRIYLCRKHIWKDKPAQANDNKPMVAKMADERARFLQSVPKSNAPVVGSRKTICDYCGDLGIDVCVYSSRQSQETVDQKLATTFAQNHAQKPRIYICRKHFASRGKTNQATNKPNVSQYLSKPTLATLKNSTLTSPLSAVTTVPKASGTSTTKKGHNYMVSKPISKKIFSILEPNVDQRPLDSIKLLDLSSLTPDEVDKFIHLKSGTNPKSFKFYDKLSLCLKKLVQYRLLPNEQLCPGCSEKMSLAKNSFDNFFWRCQNCHQNLSVTHGSFFENDILSLRLTLQLMSLWCINPGLPRDVLAMQFSTTSGRILELQKYFATVSKQWCARYPMIVNEMDNDPTMEYEQERAHLDNTKRIKLEEPDEDDQQEQMMGDACDVTTFFGQTTKVKASKDSKEGIVSIKQEPEDAVPQPKSAPSLDLFKYYRKNKEAIQTLYQVKDPFPEVFIHDYIFRENLVHENIMNHLLYEITQIWVVDLSGDSRGSLDQQEGPSSSNLRDGDQEEQPQSCPECYRLFVNVQVLDKHRAEVHRIYRKVCGKFIRCTECNAEFYLKSELNEHSRTKHGWSDPNDSKRNTIICPIKGCIYAGPTRESLAIHAFHSHRDYEKEVQIETKVFQTKEELETFYQNNLMKYLTFTRKSLNENGVVKRSGHCECEFTKSDKRRRTQRGHCSFFVTETTNPDGSVKIKYCTSHLGHTL